VCKGSPLIPMPRYPYHAPCSHGRRQGFASPYANLLPWRLAGKGISPAEFELRTRCMKPKNAQQRDCERWLRNNPKAAVQLKCLQNKNFKLSECVRWRAAYPRAALRQRCTQLKNSRLPRCMKWLRARPAEAAKLPKIKPNPPPVSRDKFCTLPRKHGVRLGGRQLKSVLSACQLRVGDANDCCARCRASQSCEGWSMVKGVDCGWTVGGSEDTNVSRGGGGVCCVCVCVGGGGGGGGGGGPPRPRAGLMVKPLPPSPHPYPPKCRHATYLKMSAWHMWWMPRASPARHCPPGRA
jgi:hypothetical protein